MFLESELFKSVILNTPLIAIDLIIRDQVDGILLGRRINKPAQGYWFVPGGRICKDETLAKAFARLTYTELGVPVNLSEAHSLGTFEHFYSDNVFGDSFSTHYVVLAYELQLPLSLISLPHLQHAQYRWYTQAELLADENVHTYTKNYFKGEHQ